MNINIGSGPGRVMFRTILVNTGLIRSESALTKFVVEDCGLPKRLTYEMVVSDAVPAEQRVSSLIGVLERRGLAQRLYQGIAKNMKDFGDDPEILDLWDQIQRHCGVYDASILGNAITPVIEAALSYHDPSIQRGYGWLWSGAGPHHQRQIVSSAVSARFPSPYSHDANWQRKIIEIIDGAGDGTDLAKWLRWAADRTASDRIRSQVFVDALQSIS